VFPALVVTLVPRFSSDLAGGWKASVVVRALLSSADTQSVSQSVRALKLQQKNYRR
jgi:hypothetical protein